MQIKPFKMTLSKEQCQVISKILEMNNIKLVDNYSNPFKHLLYKGNDSYITLSDTWQYDKYSEDMEISFDNFLKLYCINNTFLDSIVKSIYPVALTTYNEEAIDVNYDNRQKFIKKLNYDSN
jgi:hypothetical protein